jgi:Flp pilus assembly protein TadG
MRTATTLRDTRGQAMTELAIVMPVLALVLFGVIQFGIVFNNYVTLTDAVRAGARTAAVSGAAGNPSGATIARVKSAAADLKVSNLNVTVASSWQSGADVTVNADYPYSISLLGMVVASGRLRSATTERVE